MLRRYGLGPNLQRLPKRFVIEQVVVMKSGRFYGWFLRTDRGVNQGRLVYQIVFNILVVVVVRAVLLEAA